MVQTHKHTFTRVTDKTKSNANWYTKHLPPHPVHPLIHPHHLAHHSCSFANWGVSTSPLSTHTQTHTYHNSNYIIRIQYNMHHFHQMFSWIVVWWISALIMMDVCVSYPLWRRGKTRKQRRINYLLLFERQFLTEFCLIYLSRFIWEFWISPLANSKEDSIQTIVFYMNETQLHLESNLSFGKFMWLWKILKKKKILACEIYYV